jgi:aryl-alcohol dehydrogenase (NADP+)
MAGTYFSDAGLRVISTLEDIAGQRDTTIATAALAWLLTRNNIAAPIASARTAEQLPHLMAAATLRLSASDIRRLDEASAFITA